MQLAPVDDCHGELVDRVDTAVTDDRDKWESPFEEIFRCLQGFASGVRGDPFDSLRFSRLTLHNEHIRSSTLLPNGVPP